MIATIRSVYELYGFVPLDTPAIEWLPVLTGQYGGQTDMDIFTLKDPDGEPAALRFDLTVPLARVVAMYPDLPRPFKRYHVAPVWRADKPAPGRFREFLQFDADIVGTSSMAADTEIIAIMYDTLSALGVQRFIIRFSNRKVLNRLIQKAGIDPFFAVDVFRILDKVEKLSLDGVKEELMRQGEPGVDQREIVASARCLGLPESSADTVLNFLKIRGNNDEVLKQLSEFFDDLAGAREGIQELAAILQGLRSLEIPEDRYTIDLSIARGLLYYTGPVFETSLLDAERFGSVFSGGRFDRLIGRFLGEDVPATGASIGVDRLLAALEALDLIKSQPTPAQVLVTILDWNRMNDYLQIVGEIRRAGIPAELYMGEKAPIGKQLQYANRQSIPLAVIAGPKEFTAGTVTVKELLRALEDTSKQTSIERKQLIPFIRQMLS